ncbi:hypothetical protein LTR17_006424 [Elasticomyces elasticus]|nr:hypothetical protein LTR17_006424 [Elasticomyces elasticus]
MAKRTGQDDGVVQKKKGKTAQRKIKYKAPATARCMLPTIAPELRNKIYEMVLLQEGTIRIDKKLRIPALLQVCRQIRSDTLVMWHKRNPFDIIIMHCNADLLLRWDRHFYLTIPIDVGTVKLDAHIRGKPNWANLMQWCKGVWKNGGVTFKVSPGANKLVQVATVATMLADRFRFPTRRPWSECEAALEDFRLAVGAFDSKWLN